jgi:uncharacterized protein
MRKIPFGAPGCCVILAGCVTVHLYFPEAEIRNAAEEIVNEARPDGIEGAEAPPEEPRPAEGQAGSGGGAEAPRLRGDIRLAAFRAEEEPKKKVEIDISSPVIKRIRESLKKRYPKLFPWYERGVYGEGRDGYIALRGVEGLSLKEKKDVQTLLADENADRKNLYTEIARENEIDAERIADIGLLFSEEWQKKSRSGWWIEAEKGKWVRKPEEKKAKGKKTP